MKSLHSVETTSKMYPNLNPTAPKDPQAYRLQKLTEIEAFSLGEIEIREQLAKKMKRFYTITIMLIQVVLHQLSLLEEYPFQRWFACGHRSK